MALPVPLPLVRRALGLALPVAAAYLVIVAGLFVETIIVGRRLHGSGVAAIGLAGTFSLVLVLSFHALEIAAQAIISRRFGEGNFKAIGPCLDTALLLAFGLGVPLSVALFFLAPWIFSSAESAEVRQLAIDYFHYRLPSIPFVIGLLTVIGFFNAISRPKVPAFVYVTVLIVNGVLCHMFVNGAWGAPEMGIKGAGLAQTIAAIVGFVMFVFLLTQKHMRAKYHLLTFRGAMNAALAGSLLKLAAPVFVQQFLGNFGMYLFVVINAQVPDGGVSLSASTIARQIGYITYLPSLGFGIAAATLVGQRLGARQPRRAALAGFICWQAGAIFMAAVGLCFIVFWEPLVKMFIASGGREVARLTAADDYVRVSQTAHYLLIIIGIYQIFESVNTIIGKALQGAGATMFVMMVNVGAQWLLFLPLAWFLALRMELGAVGSQFAMAIQLAVVAMIFIFKFRSQGWRHKRL
ncbi:MAG TPA: MATE family efflux transporter [Candidatus Sumerlaeota bacterium]|nr:MATE family efflux transporter [Candidatus Sumerlaeota bacterium]